MVVLYGRAGRLTAKNGGFRAGPSGGGAGEPLKAEETTVFADVWNGWTPTVSHEEHTHDMSYSGDQFTNEISGFSNEDQFVMRWRGEITVPTAGAYTFQTTSDDGSVLYIDTVRVVDNDGDHGVRDMAGTIDLTEGMHAITVTFFENGGGQELTVKWSPTSGAELVVLSNDVLSNSVGCGSAATASVCVATLYQHGGYSGWSAMFSEGDYMIDDMVAHGARDNDASSLIVEGSDCHATIYENSDFTGASPFPTRVTISLNLVYRCATVFH